MNKQPNNEDINQMRRNRVQKEFISCMASEFAKKFKIQYTDMFEWELIYKATNGNLQNTINIHSSSIPLFIHFNKNYPFQPPFVKFNKRVEHPKITNDGALKSNLVGKFWSLNIPMYLVLKQVTQIIESKDFKIVRIEPFIIQRCHIEIQKQEDLGVNSSNNGSSQIQRRDYSKNNTTTETKNLNRHFRSKLRQILRQEMKKHKNESKFEQLYQFFKPNRVGFKQIRAALQVPWFNQILQKQLKSGQFLRRILNSIMNIQSKHLMLKYYPIIQQAILEPKMFSRWKY